MGFAPENGTVLDHERFTHNTILSRHVSLGEDDSEGLSNTLGVIETPGG